MKKANQTEIITQCALKWALRATIAAGLAMSAPTVGWAQTAPSSDNTTTTTTTTATPSTLPNNTPQGQTQVLSPFQVNETSEENGYGATDTVSGSRIAINYVDSAQTINVVTSQYINDYNLQDLNQLFENLPNVVSNGGTRYVGVSIRGSAVESTYIDGVFDPSTDSVGMPLQFYDRVELVSGPSSSAFGVGEPGGIINFVTKTPTGRTDTTMQLGAGDYGNYLFDLDTEGVMTSSFAGKVSYRMVAFLDTGDYQIHDEYHSGEGALISLRDDINDTTKVETYFAYSRITVPAQSNSIQSYENETAYTVTLLTEGPGATELPNTNPNIVYPSPGHNVYNGNYAGGTLLPDNSNFFAPGFSSGDSITNVRFSFSVEKSFFDKTLTIRDATTAEHEEDTYEIQGLSAIKYLLPGNQTPISTQPSGNLIEANTDNLGIAPSGVYEVFAWNMLGNDLDIDYAKRFFDDKKYAFDLRLDVGAHADQNSPYLDALVVPILNADGTQRWERLKDGDTSSYNIYGSASLPWATAVALTNKVYEEGAYFNGELTFLNGIINIEGGDRRDWYGWTQHIYEGPTPGLPNAGFTHDVGPAYSKGAPRYDIRIKPFKNLSFYAMRAEHNDPAQYVQKYGESTPGPLAPDILARFNNFNDYFTYIPSGILNEYGVKGTFFNGRLEFSGDYFKFTTGGGLFTTGIVVPTLTGGQITIFDRSIVSNHSSGIELTANGKITPRLIFTASYGITRGEYAPFADGQPNFLAPPTTLSAHIKYDFSNRGFGPYILFGGIRWGEYWADQDPYVRYTSVQYAWDGGAGFRWNRGRQSIDYIFTNLATHTPEVGAGFGFGDFTQGPGFQSFVKYTLRL